MEESMLGNGKMESGMEKGYLLLKMDMDLKVNGKMEKKMVLEI
jgi:hypothetical protein|tara:strand:+ start:225 stop:353 length:129 start_codon:yes stop_codon:yes gene_type:complete